MEEPHKPPVSKEEDVKLNKDIAAFSYVWIMSVLVYLSRKDSPFIQHHARQGLILFIISIPLWFIPLIGRLLEIIVFAGMVMGFINAFQGQWNDVPIVGPLSRGEMSVFQAFKLIWSIIMKLFKQASQPAKKPETKETSVSKPVIIVPPPPPAATPTPETPKTPPSPPPSL